MIWPPITPRPVLLVLCGTCYMETHRAFTGCRHVRYSRLRRPALPSCNRTPCFLAGRSATWRDSARQSICSLTALTPLTAQIIFPDICHSKPVQNLTDAPQRAGLKPTSHATSLLRPGLLDHRACAAGARDEYFHCALLAQQLQGTSEGTGAISSQVRTQLR